MPFVKLDCGILNSTLWFERDQREVFITALLMAEPHELKDPTPQLEVDTLNETGWSVPPGWYGFVPAAGVGIVHRARVADDAGIEALRAMGSPEASSRSQDFDGRRLVRVDGGYIILNYMRYRDRDYTAKDRMRRLRERRKKQLVTRNVNTVHPNVTQAEYRVQSTEADLETKATKIKNVRRAPRSFALIDEGFDVFWDAYPRKVAKQDALKAWRVLDPDASTQHAICAALELHRRLTDWVKEGGKFVPFPATWLRKRRWEDEVPEPIRPSTFGPQRPLEPWEAECLQLHDAICAGRMMHAAKMAVAK